MKFDINQYTGQQYAMHCSTREDAETFLDFLMKHNRSWCSGESYKNRHYDKHRHRTCYSFNEGRYGNIEWYKENNFTVLEFDDFDWDDDITPPSSRDLQRLDNFFAQFAVNKL